MKYSEIERAEIAQFNLLIQIGYVLIALYCLASIYVVTMLPPVGLLMLLAVPYAFGYIDKQKQWHKQRLDSIAFKRQVRDLYFFTKVPGLDGGSQPGFETSDAEYAVSQLCENKNEAGVRVHCMIFRDTSVTVYKPKKDGGKYSMSFEKRNPALYPATESQEEFARFVTRYVQESETERLAKERSEKNNKQWIDRYWFDQQD